MKGPVLHPTPLPGPGETLVRVRASVALAPPARVVRDRFAHRHRFRKVLFFLLREGPALTFRKIRAEGVQRRIQAERRVVVALGRRVVEGGLVVAVGPQPHPGLDAMAFPTSALRPVPDEDTGLRLMEGAAAWLAGHPEGVEAIHVHSPWSGRRLDLPEALWPAEGAAAAPRETPAPRPPEVPTAPVVARGRPGRSAAGYDLFLVGAGSYPCAYALPVLTGRRAMVVDLNPVTAAEVGRRFGFASWSCSVEELCRAVRERDAPAVVVAGYHDSHLPVAEAVLAANPGARVFLEKPPVTDPDQLARLLALRGDPRHFVEIGYNRRHTPWVAALRARLAGRTEPVALTFTVRELRLPPWHWYFWPAQGTRVVGNLSHWLDLAVHLVGSGHADVQVRSRPVPGAPDVADAEGVEVRFPDGSTLSLRVPDDGEGVRGVQERLEVRCGALSVTVDDFLRWEEAPSDGSGGGVQRRMRRDKGHGAMYADFQRRLETGSRPFYPDADVEPSCRLVLEAARLTSTDPM